MADLTLMQILYAGNNFFEEFFSFSFFQSTIVHYIIEQISSFPVAV